MLEKSITIAKMTLNNLVDFFMLCFPPIEIYIVKTMHPPRLLFAGAGLKPALLGARLLPPLTNRYFLQRKDWQKRSSLLGGPPPKLRFPCKVGGRQMIHTRA